MRATLKGFKVSDITSEAISLILEQQEIKLADLMNHFLRQAFLEVLQNPYRPVSRLQLAGIKTIEQLSYLYLCFVKGRDGIDDYTLEPCPFRQGEFIKRDPKKTTKQLDAESLRAGKSIMEFTVLNPEGEPVDPLIFGSLSDDDR